MKTKALTFVLFFLMGCSSGPEVKKQAYAELSNHRTFEVELPEVWKAIERTLSNYKISERDPNKVDDNDWKDTKERRLTTDWVYAQSRDKYEEYKVNGSPRKKYLQTRLRYKILAKRTMGGTDVRVDQEEEIEKLDKDGSSKGYSSTENLDTSRANEMIEKINLSILSAPNL